MKSTLPYMRALQQCVVALKGFGVVPAIATPLTGAAASTTEAVLGQVVNKIEAYSTSADPDVLPALRNHLEELVAEICRLLADGTPGDFAFVQAYARNRALHRFPLDALLHTYRCGQRTLLNWIRDAALAVADSGAQVRRVVASVAEFLIEYTDAVSTIATAEYVTHTRLLAEADSDRRTELLNTLLSGYDESDSRTAQMLSGSGYLEQRQSFCVAVARSVDPREMENAARAQRMLAAISRILSDTPLRSLTGIKDGLVTVVVSGTRRQSGWTQAQSLLAERIYPRLKQVGPAALIGLSTDAPSTSHVRRAYNEARLALDFASVSERVMRYSEIPFRQMLIRHARDNINPALPAWLANLNAADRKARGALKKTLQAYASANMNALQTARALSVHPNTIYARLQKIAELTGKNALNYHDLTELLLAVDSAAEQKDVLMAARPGPAV